VKRPVGTTKKAGVAWQASGGQCNSSSEQPYGMRCLCCIGAEDVNAHSCIDCRALMVGDYSMVSVMQQLLCGLWPTPAALTGSPSLFQLQRNTQLLVTHLQVGF
jgi:hypothetical protein